MFLFSLPKHFVYTVSEIVFPQNKKDEISQVSTGKLENTEWGKTINYFFILQVYKQIQIFYNQLKMIEITKKLYG